MQFYTRTFSMTKSFPIDFIDMELLYIVSALEIVSREEREIYFPNILSSFSHNVRKCTSRKSD